MSPASNQYATRNNYTYSNAPFRVIFITTSKQFLIKLFVCIPTVANFADTNRRFYCNSFDEIK